MKVYRIVVARRAEAQIEAIDRWWYRNRLDAADLFLDELESPLDRLAEYPGEGTLYPAAPPGNIQRILMRRTRYHVYYIVDETARHVCVLAVWHAARGRPPRLD
ncbi:MAG: type II toxin-antitoxin system RelE/ParE family toxin [Candidatus Schekmanbacteria bacterium]|nr:type II toxin-antitoxin system RelE/ParE family toxin [Candidatus Schekmanbacteria bacterium]